jgi:hypothetical protein
MIDRRIGEHLWVEWTGEGIALNLGYYTPEHVDVEHEIVRRALASTLQRDGVVDSLSNGFDFIAQGEVHVGWIGTIAGERDYSVCTEDGETSQGSYVDEVLPCTWVEIFE